MSLSKSDPTIHRLIKQETKRQSTQLQMIPSENYAPKAVREAVGSVLMNKYSEGQPNKRYYQGNIHIDEIEELAKKRALKLFDLNEQEWDVNVQAATGSIANLSVYAGLLELGARILGMYLYDGGHLSHGWKLPNGTVVSMTSKLFEPYYYHVEPDTGYFDYANIQKIASEVQPQIIISGGTAYPREVDHRKMGEIAKNTGAYYMADIAHEAGLVAAGLQISPFEYADIVTMTTRKTLRGPVGALIFSRKELSPNIDRAVFPGLQGGPLNHSIAGIAVALELASTNEFKNYAQQVITNCQALAHELKKANYTLASGGTDKHLLLIDLRNKDIDGWSAAIALEHAGIIVNRTTVPYDTGSPYYPSGLRLGTPAITTRGMIEKEMVQIAKWIDTSIKTTQDMVSKKFINDFNSDNPEVRNHARKNFKVMISKNSELKKIAKEVKKLCLNFPVPN